MTPASAHVVCTLAERRYFHGVAGLVNSLVQAGFAGIVVVGYRGERPSWLGSFPYDPGTDTHAVAPRVGLRLIELDGAWHLANCKPRLMDMILAELYPQADLVYYFDTDVVVTGPWDIFVRWAQSGVVAMLDIADSFMPPQHVFRREWQALAARRGFACRDVVGYVNSGCVGVSRQHAPLLRVWQALLEELERTGADMTKMKTSDGKPEFSRMDQDVLNAAMMASDTPLALLGYEAMGAFPWVNAVILHALWRRKPWDRNYVADALRGFPPGRTHLGYWRFVDGPIRPFSRAGLARKRVLLGIGRLIGLLHMRSLRDI